MTVHDPEVFDEGALDRLLRIGGQGFVVEMIGLFLENAPQRLESARASREAGDWQGLYRSAHSLKSTAGNLGARALQAVAERLEDRALARDADAVGPLISELAVRYEEARDRLEGERDRRGVARDRKGKTP